MRISFLIFIFPTTHYRRPTPCFGMVMGNLGVLCHGASIVFSAPSFDAATTLLALQKEKCTSMRMSWAPLKFNLSFSCNHQIVQEKKISFGDFFGEMNRRQEFQTKLPQPGLAFLDGAKSMRFCSTRPP